MSVVLQWLLLLSAICLMVWATVSQFRSVNRFESTSTLLSYEAFDDQLSDWQVRDSEHGQISVEDGVLTLEQTETSGYLSLVQEVDLLPEDKFLRISVTVAGQDIVPGETRWESARIIYLELDDSQTANLRKQLELARLSGTEPVQQYSADMEISKETKQLQITMLLLNTTGKMQVSALSLHRLELTDEYKYIRFWLICGWALVLLWCLIVLARAIPTSTGRAVILVAGTIFVLAIVAPGAVTDRVFEWVEKSLNVSRQQVEYAAHFLGFAVFGVLLKFVQSHRPLLFLLALCLAVSLVSEVLQLMTLDRSLQFTDLLVDFAGAGLGVLVGTVLLELWRNLSRWRDRRKRAKLLAREAIATDDQPEPDEAGNE